MRLPSTLLLAVLPLGLAIPLIGRSPEAYDTPTPATPSTGVDLPKAAAAASSTSAIPASGAGTIPAPSSNDPLGGLGSELGPAAVVVNTIEGLTGGLGGVGGVGSLVGSSAVPGIKARDLDTLPAPLLKRLEDLALDIRAELESRDKAVEGRDSPTGPTLGSLGLTDAQLVSLAQATGLTTTALKGTPLSTVSTLPGISNLSPENLSGLNTALQAVGGVPLVGGAVGQLTSGVKGARKVVRDEETSGTSLGVDRLIAV